MGTLSSYELPDWTDPPTLQVPRVLLDLEQEAAAERGGPPTPPPGGPVWRERQEDWDDTDAVLARLASAGPSVTDYEESSSDDPFAYDFLDLDDDASWLSRDDVVEESGPQSRAGEAAFAPVEISLELGEVEEPAPMQAASVSSSAEDQGDVQAPSPRQRKRRLVAPRRVPPRHPKRRRHASWADVTLPSPATLSSPRSRGWPWRQSYCCAFIAGPVAVLVLAALAVTLATAELFNSLRLAGYRPATLLGILGVPAVMVGAYLRGPVAIVTALVIFIVVSMIWYLAGVTRRSPLANLSVTVLAFGWTGVLGAFAGLLLDPSVFPDRHGIAFMLGAVIAAVGYDIGGYVIGSRLGRHSLAPSVSPNKTWEGLVGGCLIAVAASAAVTSRIHPWDLKTAVLLGVVVAVVAPFGDLVESMIKRDLGVKDMGTLLPGHGGMMDRIDALLFVLPAAYFFIRLAHIA